MKISGTVLLVFFLVFQSNSAVMGDASAAATEKTIPQAPTATLTQTLTLVPTVNLEPYFSIGPGFRLPYLEILANYYYYPWQTYYTTTIPTYWVGKKTTVAQSPKTQTNNKNQTITAEKVENSQKNQSLANETQNQGGKKLLDLGKNISSDNNNQKVKQVKAQSDEGSQAPAEKSVIDEAVKSSAEKNLKSQVPQVEPTATEKKTDKGPEDAMTEKGNVPAQNEKVEKPAETSTQINTVSNQSTPKAEDNSTPVKPSKLEQLQDLKPAQIQKKSDQVEIEGSVKDETVAIVSKTGNSDQAAEVPMNETPKVTENPPKSENNNQQIPVAVITGLTFQGENSDKKVQLPEIVVEP